MKRRISHLIVVTLLSATIIVGLCPQVYAADGENPSNSIATETLEEGAATREELQALLDESDALFQNDYTEESAKVFKDAWYAAKAVIDKEDSTQDEIQSAYDALNNAISALVRVPANKDYLRELVAEAEAIDPTKYTKESYAYLQEALKKAKDVIADEYASQFEVAKADMNLYYALTTLVSKDSLQELVTNLKKLNPSDFTEESYAALQNAIAYAQSVLDDQNASQEDCDNAYRALIYAGQTLVFVEDPTPASSKDTSNTSSKKPSTNPKTSDNMAAGFVLLTLALAGASTLILKRKNK